MGETHPKGLVSDWRIIKTLFLANVKNDYSACHICLYVACGLLFKFTFLYFLFYETATSRAFPCTCQNLMKGRVHGVSTSISLFTFIAGYQYYLTLTSSTKQNVLSNILHLNTLCINKNALLLL